MRKNKDHKIIRLQESQFYYLDMVTNNKKIMNRQKYDEKLYTRMLIEDISMGLMPIGSGAKKPFRVFITPPDPKIERLISASIDQSDYRRDLADSIYNFFKQCSQTIMAYGEATYELVYLYNKDKKSLVGFEFFHIPSQTLVRRHGKLMQYIPNDIAKAREIPQYIRLSPDNIVTFNIPNMIKNQYKHIMDSLSYLSDKIMPDFAQPWKKDIEKIPFDLKIHIRTQKLALAHAGKLIGWNARGLFDNEILEFYYTYRHLIFERFKINFRNDILERFNDGLARVGKKLGFSAQLKIEGLPSLLDVEKAQQQLEKGDKSFIKILDDFL